MPSVTSIRPPTGYVFLPAETYAPIPSIPGLYVYLCYIKQSSGVLISGSHHSRKTVGYGGTAREYAVRKCSTEHYFIMLRVGKVV